MSERSEHGRAESAEEPVGKAQKKGGRGSGRGFKAWLTRRHDPLTSLLLTIPVFLIYHLGILLPFVRMRNGVDLVSGLTFSLLNRSLLGYLGVTAAYVAVIAVAAYVLKRKGSIQPAEFLPMLGESAVLAVIMSLTVGWATAQVFDGSISGSALVGLQAGAEGMNPIEKLVMAAGAGFHEELVFRVVLFAGGTWALSRVPKLSPLQAALIAAVVSSLVFSAVHYIPPHGDALRLDSFTFRFLAGLFLVGVYRWRGFAVAVYTHAIYDVIVFFF